jgi:uncharacterized membrane protein YhdT
VPPSSAVGSRRDRVAISSVLVCAAAGIALFLAFATWTGLCQEGTQSGCRDGVPSFEIVAQAVLAVAALAVSIAALHFVNRRARRRARAALAVAIVLLAAWVVLVDAATHGWDDLQVPIRVVTVAVVLAPLVIVAVVLRRTR